MAYLFVKVNMLRDLLKYNMEQCKSANTPMSATLILDQDIHGKSVDQNTYNRGMIGSLFYLTASRTDIMFSVYLCTRF